MTGKIYDKMLSGTAGYAIFFDNVRVDQFVTNWSTQCNVDGGIGSASIEMIYLPDLYRLHTANQEVKVGNQTIIDSQEVAEGIENMTNVRIFVKNMFTEKYCSVFDGNLKAKALSKTGNNYKITFSASDYLTWFNKTIVPLAIPIEERLDFPDRMRWKAQGINLDEIPTINQIKDIHFRGKNIEEMWNEIVDRTMAANMLYTNSEAAIWDNPTGRVVHMADIDPKYTKEQSAIDFIVTASATMVNSIYVLMNDLIKSILMEFFQDRDGQIRIKAPFWSEPILKGHVIDPIMITNFTESINWDSQYSRVIATGGLEWYEDDMTAQAKAFITPTAVYRTDGTYSMSEAGSLGGGAGMSTPQDITGANTGTWLDNWSLAKGFGTDESGQFNDGIDWVITGSAVQVKHIGAKGRVSAVADEGTQGRGKYVTIEITEGIWKGGFITYSHLYNFAVAPGELVSDGKTLGVFSGGGRLHVSVKIDGGPRNPIYYFVETGKPGTLGNYEMSIGNDDLLIPTEFEKKYGPSIFNVDQPMIKFSTAGDTISNRQSMFEVLKDYAKFMLLYLNSTVNVATVQTVAMPWLRAGFNIWVDPIGIDRVYYVSSLSFQGSAAGGVYTNLGLIMGRTMNDFISGTVSSFATLNPGVSGSLFINQMHDGFRVADEKFGKIIGKTANDYKNFRTAALKFHMGINTEEISFISSVSSKYYQGLYGKSTIPAYDLPKKSKKQGGKSSIDTSNINPAKWNRTLERGSSGKDVEDLQKLLINAGYYKIEDLDGKFGPKTEEAVKAFQKANNLTPDGKVGPKTRAAFIQHQAQNTSILSECTSILRLKSTGKYVRALQELLSKFGFFKETIGDVFDKNTENAVKAFQLARKLKDDGIVGPITRAELLSYKK